MFDAGTEIGQSRVLPASAEHSDFLARVILAASRSQFERGPFDIVLGEGGTEEDVLDILEWMTLSDVVSSCHFSRFLVAEVDSSPVGALAALDPSAPGVLPIGAAIADAYDGLELEPESLPRSLARIDAIQACLPPVPPHTWLIEWVAVEPFHRRHGVVSALLAEAMRLGARNGLQRIQISTYIGNTPAIRAYEKAGFQREVERRDADFEALIGSPGLVTMTREFS